MPNTNFNWAKVTPGAMDEIDLAATESVVIEVTVVNDQVNYPGDYRLVPDLTVMRQTGSDLVKQFTNVASPGVSDENGLVTNAAALTGGYAALRQYLVNESGQRIYDEALIPCGVGYVTNHGTSAGALALNGFKVRLVFDPRPGLSTTAGLDPNKKASLFVAHLLPFVVVSSALGMDEYGGGGGGA